MISEIEEIVLRVLMLGERRIDGISRKSGLPEILVEKVVDRLIEKGYIDHNLRPLEKAYEDLRWVDRRSFSIYKFEIGKMFRMMFDLVIVLVLILLVISILQYFGLIYNQFLMIAIYSIVMIFVVTLLYFFARGYRIPIFERIAIHIKKREIVSRIQEVTSQFRSPPYLRVAFILTIFLILVYMVLTYKVFFVVVTSESMVPTLNRGDLYLAQSIVIDPEPGDIVMFRRPNTYLPISHRVLRVEGGKIYTGGDASGPDPWTITRRDVIAEAVMVNGKPIVIRNLGTYFILDATKLRSIGPYGQAYLFYKNLVNAFKSYSAAIMIVAISIYVYLELRRR